MNFRNYKADDSTSAANSKASRKLWLGGSGRRPRGCLPGQSSRITSLCSSDCLAPIWSVHFSLSNLRFGISRETVTVTSTLAFFDVKPLRTRRRGLLGLAAEACASIRSAAIRRKLAPRSVSPRSSPIPLTRDYEGARKPSGEEFG